MVKNTNDYCTIPQQLKDQVRERYTGARQTYLKSGGDFPFLSRPDEVNLRLQLQLRQLGLEARPDLVPGMSKDSGGGGGGKSSTSQNNGREGHDDASGGGSSSAQNDQREDTDDVPIEHGENSECPSTESQPAFAPENIDSNSDSPLSESQLPLAPKSTDSTPKALLPKVKPLLAPEITESNPESPLSVRKSITPAS